ncbi:hypothetical protein VTK73DRAFT_7447 [Phialemonium thermophilum]|uniref:Uncharacterized protein n=1 Tax=Phialemonium thermophilum TaxID=223376 RepID=A0ABR3WEK6_9PEZI
MYSTAIYGAAAVVLVAICVLRPVALYLLDPLDLRKYPSPSILAALSSLWLMRETYYRRRSRAIHEAHRRLGPVIRVAPNQLIFNEPQAVPDIYGHVAARKIVKDVFYDSMAGAHRSLVTARDHEEHGRKRRYLSNVFALRTIVEMEPVIRNNIGHLLRKMDEFCEQACDSAFETTKGGVETKSTRVLDMRNWFNYFTLDVIADMAFGISMGFVETGSDQCYGETKEGTKYAIPSFVPMLHKGIRYSLTLAQLVDVGHNKLAKSVTSCSRWLRKVTGMAAAVDYENFCRNHLKKRLAAGAPDRRCRDFMDRVIRDREGVDRKLPFGELMADTSNMMNAGSETTAAALCSTLWFLVSNPSCFQKLRAEIDERIRPDDPESIVPYDRIRDARYLRACIDEAMRLRPPIGYALQRLVVDPSGATIAGRHVRQGTVVAVSPVTIQRNETLYPEPDRYNPDRWLDESNPQQISALKTFDIVFSQGPRACIGRHLAIVEMQILISSLVRRYDFRLCEDGQDLKTLDLFNANPGPLPLQVRRRELK